MRKQKEQAWSKEAISLAKELHAKLSLNDKNWHSRKSNSDYRAAELLSGAIIHLLQGGKTSDVEQLASQAVLWLKKELKDPGCPKH